MSPSRCCSRPTGPNRRRKRGRRGRSPSHAGRRPLGRSRPRRGGRCTGGRSGSGSARQLLLLRFDELTIIRRIEVEKRPTGSEMLDENLPNQVCCAGGDHRHRNCADGGSNSRQSLHETSDSDRRAGRNHRSCKAGYDRFAEIVGKRNAVNLRQTAKHLELNSADRSHVDERYRDKSGRPGPQREPVDQLRRSLVALLVRHRGRIRHGRLVTHRSDPFLQPFAPDPAIATRVPGYGRSTSKQVSVAQVDRQLRRPARHRTLVSTELKTNISPPGWASCLSRCLGPPGRVRKHAVSAARPACRFEGFRTIQVVQRTDCSRGGKVNALRRRRGSNHRPAPRRLASWLKPRRSLIITVLAIVDVDAPPALLLLADEALGGLRHR